MCIGVKRRAAPVGGFSNQHANVALLNQINEKAQPSRVPSALGLAPLSCTSSSSYTKKTRPGKHHITVQHNYHDHAYDVNCGQPRRMPAKGGVVTPFPLKLHTMLDAVEKEGLEHIVSWQPHGRCFVVHDPKAFADILAEHFKVSKVSSFQRQLNLYGFQRLTKGKDRGGYYHELFLRGKVFLAQSIQRIKVKGTKIRARSNPDQEPNFYAMPWVVENNKKTTTTTNSSYNNRAVVERDPLDELVGLTIPPSMWDLDETPIAEINADIPASMWREEDAKFADEAETFFEDFDFPENDSAFENIEDDDVFGDLLEQMIGV